MAISGIRAPYARVFYREQELTVQMSRFTYTYSEAEDDICEMDFETSNPKMADDPMFTVRNEFKISWGYAGESNTVVTRKIYLQDAKWEYGSMVKGSLIFTDKAKSLAFENAPQVHTNKSLPEIANDIAKKHDLKTKVGVLQDDPSPARNLTGVLEGQKQERVKALKQVFVDFDTWDKTYNKRKEGWKYGQLADDNPTISSNTELPNKFNIYKSIPNGRVSDRVFLQKLAKREKGGNTVIETRDDEVIIKKRNFNQAPYKSYVYKGEGNEVIEFSPEYKNRRRAGTANNLAFSGWDKDNKQFYMGNTNSIMDNTSDALGKIQEMATYLKGLPQNQIAGVFDMDPLTGRMRYNKNKAKAPAFVAPHALTGGGSAVYSLADNTNTFKDIKIPVTVGEDRAALDAAIANQTSGKAAYDPTSNNPFDAFNNAANLRNEAELNRNPATLKIEGDTGVKVGLVVTILGAAKKHTGNYYAIKSTHTIENDYYTVDMDLVRDGSNFVHKEAVDVTKFGKYHNSKTGPIGTKPNTKTLKSKKQ